MVHINGKTFNAEYLKTPEEIEKGMMGRESLDGCMVFKMGKGHHSFWMKNCLIPLDIVFVLNNRINRIHSNCPVEDSHRMTLPRYSGIGDHVIEFPAGTTDGWKMNDRVAMYLGTPQNPVAKSYNQF
jgi:uncharacterized membrane protein (UPF0127 family)